MRSKFKFSKKNLPLIFPSSTNFGVTSGIAVVVAQGGRKQASGQLGGIQRWQGNEQVTGGQFEPTQGVTGGTGGHCGPIQGGGAGVMGPSAQGGRLQFHCGGQAISVPRHRLH